jgi:predicted peptidase
MKYQLLALLLTTVIALQAQDFSAYEKRMFKDADGGELPYRILFPDDYDSSKSYPLVLFLHGAGERGDDNEAQLTHGADLFLKAENRTKFPAIVVFPQCPKEDYWAHVERSDDRKEWFYPFYESTTPAMQKVEGLLDQLMEEEAVDQSRLYVAGLSMGGMGTFDLLAHRPYQFAAAMPICGGGNLVVAERYAGSTPLWIFHGDADAVVPVELSRNMYERLQNLGADVKYTEYAGVNHNSWDNAFAEAQFLPWLFSQQKKQNDYLYQQPIFEDIERSTLTYTEMDGEKLAMDLYVPKDNTLEDRPLLLFVHGGGFSGGKRDTKSIQTFANRLASTGYVVASISYRLTMKGQSFSCDQPTKNKILTFQKSVEDIRAATNFLIEKQADLQIDPSKIVLAGSSAGAEAILHSAYWSDEHLLENSPKLPTDFQYAALISLAGAIIDDQLLTSDNAIPSLFFHGTCDPLVPYDHAPHHYCDYDEVGYLPLYGGKALADRLQKLDGTYQLVTAVNGGHEWAGVPTSQHWQTMAEFIYRSVVQGERFQVMEWVETGKECGLGK